MRSGLIIAFVVLTASTASYASTPLPEGLTLRDPKTGDFVHYSYADLVAKFARPLDYSLLEEDIKPTIIGKEIVELHDPRTGDMREYSFIELHYELQCRYQIEMKQQGRWKSDEEVTEEGMFIATIRQRLEYANASTAEKLLLS